MDRSESSEGSSSMIDRKKIVLRGFAQIFLLWLFITIVIFWDSPETGSGEIDAGVYSILYLSLFLIGQIPWRARKKCNLENYIVFEIMGTLLSILIGLLVYSIWSHLKSNLIITPTTLSLFFLVSFVFIYIISEIASSAVARRCRYFKPTQSVES